MRKIKIKIANLLSNGYSMIITEVFTMGLNVFVITCYGYLLNNRDNVLSLRVIGSGLGDRIHFPAGTNIFPFAIASRLALGPTERPMH
jgi:hypothetical protein